MIATLIYYSGRLLINYYEAEGLINRLLAFQ